MKKIISAKSIRLRKKQAFILLLVFSGITKSSFSSDPLMIIKKLIPKKPVILESGARFGIDTKRMAKLWPKAQIYAFEPNPNSYEKLKKNTNHLSNVKIHKLALSDFCGTSEFWVSTVNPGASSLLKKNTRDCFLKATFKKDPIYVECLTIDDWAKSNDVETIDFMWLDMEGYELFALQASPNIFQTTKVIYMEVNYQELLEGEPLYQEVKSWMEDQGFHEIWHQKMGNFQANVIFARNCLPDDFIVDFHECMSRNRVYKKEIAENDQNYKLLRFLYEEHIVKNIKYSKTPRIPKIIHQIWLGNNGKLPQKYHFLQKTWLKNHPEWEYKLWTEKELEKFGLINKKLFDEVNNYGGKADIARLEILYRIGGLYVDTDFECTKPLDIFHHICDFYAPITYCDEARLTNALIGAVPGHPILKSCIDALGKVKVEKNKKFDVYNITGPPCLTKGFFKEIENCDGPCVGFPIGYFLPWPAYFRHLKSREEIEKWISPETFGIHHWHASWVK